MDVAYVGKTAVNLVRTRNINQLLPGTIQANPGVQTNALRPYHGLAALNYTTLDGRSNFNSFQLSVDRRFATGLGFGVSYTFSKGLDNVTTPYNALRFQRAPFEWDRPHVFNMNAMYELPILRNTRGLAGNLLGGWQVSGVVFFRSGSPLSVTDGTDVAGTGQAGAPWDLVGNIEVTGKRGLGTPWFNAAAFAVPRAGTFGNAGLGIIRGPRFQSIDGTLFKRFRILEKLNSELRLEVFNIPNHPLLADPVTNPRVANFGSIVTKTLVSQQANVSTNERNVQVGLKFIF